MLTIEEIYEVYQEGLLKLTEAYHKATDYNERQKILAEKQIIRAFYCNLLKVVEDKVNKYQELA